MKSAAKYLLSGAVFAAAGVMPAAAADIYEPTVIESPAYQAPEAMPTEVSGWYLRGDVGYAWHQARNGEYAIADVGPTLVTATLFGDSFRGSYTLGAGVGYKYNHYLRSDVTLDWWGNGQFTGHTFGTCDFGGGAVACTSTDVATFSALTLMANAYVDLGTYGRFTPYVGGGFGGSHVHWGTLRNTACEDGNPANCDTTYHGGRYDWRFAYALMAGVSVDVTCSTSADFGYKYQRITSGEMFGTALNAGYGHDGGISSHQVRAGLRYKLGGCQKPVEVVYQPEPLPVYK
ncbi:MAG: outer membrane protein [Oricola sp.]